MQCKVSGTILEGDAVCVIGWDNGPPSVPLVARATRTNLATSKTVHGVAEAPDGAGYVEVHVAGAAVPSTLDTGLAAGAGAGTSHVIATDYHQAAAADQCRLLRVERPDGSEHVVGTCDENGNLAVQPHASRDTSARHVFSVVAYGAVGDGKSLVDAVVTGASPTHVTSASAPFSSDDLDKKIRVVGAGSSGANLDATIVSVNSASDVTISLPAITPQPNGVAAAVWGATTDNVTAITNAVNAVPTSGGRLFFPPGVYVVPTSVTIPDYVQVEFDQGAMIVTAGAAVTITGRVTCHHRQQIFGGFGYSSAVVGGPPAIAVSGNPLGNYDFTVTITDATHFTYQVAANPVPSDPPTTIPSGGTFTIPTTALL
jgi:hypothetical protein